MPQPPHRSGATSASTRAFLASSITLALALAFTFTLALALLGAMFTIPAAFATPNANAVEQRHPLEIEALTQPRVVLAKLPAARKALAEDDRIGAAKLALAEANACRVIADWRCQRRAGSVAMTEADRTASVYLQVRARIALGRGLSRIGDFNSAARVLAEAQRRLGEDGDDALMADVLLAYSSISERLGKLDESYRYAKEGLAHAPAETQTDMRLRLLRNMAHIASVQGRAEEARDLLQEANALVTKTGDPKLAAEVLLEVARAARATGDAATVEAMGERIGAIGDGLKNTQLHGLSYETKAQALELRGKNAEAVAFYREAQTAFAALKLDQDEIRTVRAMVDLQLKGVEKERLSESIARLIQLGDRIARTEREAAAADFEERLRYAESDAELARVNAKAENERLRAMASEDKFRYTLIAGVLALCTLGVVAVLYSQQRRHAAMMRERGREMEIAISTDFLTSVHSRRFITDAGHAAFENALDKSTGFAVAVVDIDHFKTINDRFGHAVGDDVLKAVAHAMRATCRDSDTLGRYGGEEFAVLLEGISPEHALAAAERLRKAVAAIEIRIGDDTIAPTASVGVACLAADDRDFDHVLVRADRALYRAKEEGRNRVILAE
ncbi:MAG: diguanylate cyclase [Lysobacter sp.]|nr:diguanylate cyclase [Lysobacter sp.]